MGRIAFDQTTSLAGLAFNDSLCQNLPLGRRETVWQQRASIVDVETRPPRSRKLPLVRRQRRRMANVKN